MRVLTSDGLETEHIDGDLVVRFTRPEIRNPLSVGVLVSLTEIVGACATSADIEKVVFTGVDDVFASGADLREIADIDHRNAAEFARRGQVLMSRIASLRQITIAAVNGYCFGGALDLALACKRRIASPNATFSHPGVGLGIITGWGGTQRLPRLFGEAKALEIFLTAKRINADEALRIGLIDEIADDPLAASLAN